MKRRILTATGRLLVALVALVMTAVTSATAGEIRHTLTFDPTAITFDTVTAPDGTPYVMVNAPDANYLEELPAPLMPCKVINLLMPTFCENIKVTLENVQISNPIVLTNKILTNRELSEWHEYGDLVTDSSNQDRGGWRAWIINDYLVNGKNHIVSVAVPIGFMSEQNPCILNPLLNVDVKLDYEECGPQDVDYCCIESRDSEWDTDLDTLVVNPPRFNENAVSQSKAQTGSFELMPESYYYILVPESLKESVNDLASWKSQKGHTVRIHTVEEIWENPLFSDIFGEKSFDKESHIRNWLRSEYSKYGKFQLLIIGDYRTSAPIRKFRNYTSNSKEHYSWYDGENFVPTDAYFSEMTTSFTLDSIANGNYYGAILKQKYSPELRVGRLLAYQKSHLARYLDKLLIYEINPGLGNPDYLGKGFINRQHMFVSSPTLFKGVSTLDLITLNDEKGGLVYSECEPTGQEVILGMGQCGIISLKGHGSPVTICTAGDRKSSDDWEQNRYIQAVNSYSTQDTRHPNAEHGNGLDGLDNAGKPSILYTFACTSTPFDNIRFPGGGYRNVPFDMGSSFTVGGNYGGVAYIGNTRDGYTGPQEMMETDFGYRISKGESIGNAFANSVLATGDRHQQFTRNLIGDPDINVWLGVPSRQNISVSYQSGILTINGTDMENARAIVFNGERATAVFRITGHSTVSLTAEEIGVQDNSPFTVSIFKNGHYPEIYLLASNSGTVQSSKKFYLPDINLLNDDIKEPQIQVSGNLGLYCIGNFRSRNYFDVMTGGNLMVQANGQAEFEGERICCGAKVSISAHETVLGAGFTVEKGAGLNISNDN